MMTMMMMMTMTTMTVMTMFDKYDDDDDGDDDDGDDDVCINRYAYVCSAARPLANWMDSLILFSSVGW